MTNVMIDVQNELDFRQIPLQKVGVKNVKYPVTVLDKEQKTQRTTAIIDLSVNLPQQYKGTHMSRFIEIFHKYHENLTVIHFLEMLEEICKKLNAKQAFGSMKFLYFIEKKAPVSHSPGIMEYNCSYEASVSFYENNEKKHKFFVCIEVPIATLCPCSKAISDYGAHNQRGKVKVKIQYKDFFWIEDIIFMIEQCCSTPVYSVLKRNDEKFVTEHSYDNPFFVEDVVRDVYLGLKKMNFDYFTVEAETEESIHNHNAFAFAEFGEKK
ncbi:MAG: GTP cyclohydrolase FolE2 [Treponemataceae bacterium]